MSGPFRRKCGSPRRAQLHSLTSSIPSVHHTTIQTTGNPISPNDVSRDPASPITNPLQHKMSSPQDWQREAMRRFRQMQSTTGGGGPGGSLPKGSPGLLVGGLLLAGGAYVFSNSLFNVDGGHRAIKYRRISGVSNEIYNEGMLGHRRFRGSFDLQKRLDADCWDYRNPYQHPLV